MIESLEANRWVACVPRDGGIMQSLHSSVQEDADGGSATGIGRGRGAVSKYGRNLSSERGKSRA